MVILYFLFIYSIRILPHHQDTGGFFVAVMEKIKPLPWEASITPSDELVDEAKVNNYKRKPKKRKYQGYREDPFIFLTVDDPVWPEIRYLILLINFIFIY